MRRGVSLLFFFVVVTAHGADANAQQPPSIQWVKPGQLPTDASGSARQPSDAIDIFSTEPLRLALLSSFLPHRASEPGCADSPELVGSFTGSSPSFPSQRALGMRVFGSPSSLRAPRLSLFGFSRGGCQLDAAVSAGVTFTVPIRASTFFVLSGGAIYLPHGAPDGTAVANSTVRADVVIRGNDGRPWTVGVGVDRVTAGPRVSVGGVF